MGDSARDHEWGRYLRRMTDRPGWSVARLARESGINRATIFGWIKDGGDAVMVQSIKAIAQALGDSTENALRAAADLPPLTEERVDEELEAIRNAPVDPDLKLEILRELMSRREREQSQRLRDLRFTLDGWSRGR